MPPDVAQRGRRLTPYNRLNDLDHRTYEKANLPMASHSLQPRQLIEFTSFDAAFAVSPDDEDATRRRYMTLLVDAQYAPRRGASSTVYRVSNTECAVFALKVLKTDDIEEEGRARVLPVRVRTFLEEYRAQAVVSHLAGFPRLYGYGMIDDVPAILMEWIEGFTLNEVTPQLPADIYGRIDARAIAGIGRAVLSPIIAAKSLDESFVHRDLSPKNIMVRCDRTPLEEQVKTDTYDICLVDMGSATAVAVDSSLTMMANIWRAGTPDYAPPEMLTSDDPTLVGLRSSSAIDVYALCSILYELYAQTPPYGRGISFAASSYRVKMDNDPLPLVPRSAADTGLTDAIMAGLARDQADRIDAEDLAARLDSWLAEYGREADTTKASDTATPRASTAPASTGTPGDTPNKDAGQAVPATAPARLISRRSFLAGALCGAGLVAAGGAAVYTKGFGLLAPRTLGSYTWQELSDISAEISAAENSADAIAIANRYGLVDAHGNIDGNARKDIEFNGIPLQVQLVDINHDELADGSGYAGLTFMFSEIAISKPMNDEPYTDGGWEACDMRAYLNSNFMDKLPTDLAELIVPVTKNTNNVGGTKDPACVTPTEETVWLFSYCELAGQRARLTFNEGYRFLADILNAEGSQYAYFEQQHVMPQSAASCLIRNLESDQDYWWLRSASPDVSMSDGVVTFNRVGPNGDPFHFATACTETSGVLPGFCL